MFFFFVFLSGVWLPGASRVPSILQSFLPQNSETILRASFHRITQIPRKLLRGYFSESDMESPEPVACDTGAAVYERDLGTL